jgi:hypothetical protein
VRKVLVLKALRDKYLISGEFVFLTGSGLRFTLGHEEGGSGRFFHPVFILSSRGCSLGKFGKAVSPTRYWV